MSAHDVLFSNSYFEELNLDPSRDKVSLRDNHYNFY